MVCIVIGVSFFASVGIENAVSPYTVTIEDDPNPGNHDLAVFSSDISVEEPVMVAQATTVGAEIFNLGISYIVTWHDGDYTEYDFNQGSDTILDISLRIRSSGDPTVTDVHLDGSLIATFDATPAFDIVTIHDVPVSAGDHTARITQASDIPAQGDDLLIDWLQIGANRIQAELYDLSSGTDINPDCRGVDTIVPSRITAKFLVNDVLIGENFNVGSHSNSVTGGVPPHQEFFIPNDGYNQTSTSWVPSAPGFHTVCVEVSSGTGSDSDLTNNRACISAYVNDILPPTLYISPSPNGMDAVLYWDPPPSLDLDYYLIYRSSSQTNFDFDTVWMNTSIDINPVTGVLDPLYAMWLDKNVTNGSHPEYRDEYYYTIRAVNMKGQRSTTSNTVGYYIMQFDEGNNTFSMPLQSFVSPSLNALMSEMGASSISWLDANDDWLTYPLNPLTPQAEMGMGYVVEFSNPSRYVFTGEPASMIIYKEGFGFDFSTRDDINAEVDSFGNVNVTWTPIAGADRYYVHRSNFRHGFFNDSYDVIEVMAPVYQDFFAATLQDEFYYLVIPWNSILGNGSSTYSIGVFTEEYNGNEMFGLPLKPIWGDMSADWYVDQIPNCLGIVFLANGDWKAHFKEFPERVYDTTIEMGRGYELSVHAMSRYSFVGW
jgi:hypothetical protein